MGAGQIVQRYDPPRSRAGRMGGIRVKNWQAHSDLTILAGYAPQESGPLEPKQHFWDHVTKTMAKFPKLTSIKFGGDFNGDPMRDDAAIGRHHACETITDNGENISEICAAAQLWSPTAWAARPMPPDPSWEESTWRGQNGVQSRPDHILLSVTCDGRFSILTEFEGNCARSDRSCTLEDRHAVSAQQQEEAEALGQSVAACSNDGPPLCEAFD